MSAAFDGQRADETITAYLDRITAPVEREGDVMSLATFVAALVLKYSPLWETSTRVMPSEGGVADQVFVLRETMAALEAAARRMETAHRLASGQEVVS